MPNLTVIIVDDHRMFNEKLIESFKAVGARGPVHPRHEIAAALSRRARLFTYTPGR